MPKVYLDNACTSLVQPRVLASTERFVNLFKSSDKSASDITREIRSYLVEARKAVADFLHCDSGEIAIVESTSHALGILAQVLPLEKKHNVLICDLEYQASTLCLKRRQEEVGFEMREVKSVNGTITAEIFAQAADADTKVIILASVQEINGYRADVKAIREMARGKNILLVVDGIQEVGAMKVDLRDLDVDFYCAGGKKWLGNPFGAGFLYVNKRLIRQIPPPFYAYFKIEVDKKYTDYINYLEDPARNPFDPYTIIEDASKYENGGFANGLGALGLKEAVSLLGEMGADKIQEKILSLQERLIKGLAALGIKVCSATDRKHMSSIASFNFGFKDGIEKERRLVKFLQAHNIYISLRSSTGTGGIRMSPHYYNTERDIDALVEGIALFLKEDKAAGN
ncbi:aminotransferase V [Deltaproteobacteria bacterium]|nr:aminotransferase V [Deltaproteobacteria bacterium]